MNCSFLGSQKDWMILRALVGIFKAAMGEKCLSPAGCTAPSSQCLWPGPGKCRGWRWECQGLRWHPGDEQCGWLLFLCVAVLITQLSSVTGGELIISQSTQY